MSSHSASSAAERTLFIGPRVPNHIKSLAKLLPSIKKPAFRQLVKLAVLDFEGKNVTPEMYNSIAKEGNGNIDAVYGALYALLKCALSLPEASLKQEVFKEDLHELKLPDDYIDDLANVIFGPRRLTIAANFLSSTPHLPKLEKFQWRVDVTISTSTLSRVLEPIIIMGIELSDGRKVAFEVFPSRFHQLRFAAAFLLKEMGNLQTKNVLKL